jgi:hypothetical protein
MTADDFFLLFVAFGGFVVVPALLLWGFARFTHRTQSGSRGPGIPPDVGSPGTSNGEERKEAVRSGQADNVLRRLAGWTRHGVASST